MAYAYLRRDLPGRVRGTWIRLTGYLVPELILDSSSSTTRDRGIDSAIVAHAVLREGTSLGVGAVTAVRAAPAATGILARPA